MTDPKDLIEKYNNSVPPSKRLTPDQVHRVERNHYGGSVYTGDLPKSVLRDPDRMTPSQRQKLRVRERGGVPISGFDDD